LEGMGGGEFCKLLSLCWIECKSSDICIQKCKGGREGGAQTKVFNFGKFGVLRPNRMKKIQHGFDTCS